MASRLRSESSPKVSFFAFLDIITAVTGILILVTLILATDIGGYESGQSGSTPAAGDETLQKVLRSQAKVEIENARLRRLAAAAASAPALPELQSETQALQRELSVLESQFTALAGRKRHFAEEQKNEDAELGIDQMREKVSALRAASGRAEQTNDQLRAFLSVLDRRILDASQRLAKAQSLRGQSWLRPDDRVIGKRPVVIMVDGQGAGFKPLLPEEATVNWPASSAESKFRSFCRGLDSSSQYIVFLIRPSGIELFDNLVEIARDRGLDVGYDAITEAQVIHVGPPPLDNPVSEPAGPSTGKNRSTAVPSPPTGAPRTLSPDNPAAPDKNADKVEAAPPAPAPPASPAPPPPPKTWWERFVAFVKGVFGKETS